jgi:hypothetical protein
MNSQCSRLASSSIRNSVFSEPSSVQPGYQYLLYSVLYKIAPHYGEEMLVVHDSIEELYEAHELLSILRRNGGFALTQIY